MLQRIVLAFALVLASGAAAAEPAVSAAQEHMIGVRVAIDPSGKVVSATPSDPAAMAALNQAAVEIARKLSFDAGTKDGVPVASETSLFLNLVIEPKATGQFAIRLKKAVTGPDRSKSAPVIPPTYQQRGDRRALAVVSFNLRADGTVDPATIKAERMELKVKSSFAEARYLDAIAASLRDSRFVLDKVAGIDIPAHLTLPYQFGGGGGRGGKGGEERRASTPSSVDAGIAADKPADPSGDTPAPEMKVESLVPGVTLPKVRFVAPVQPAK
jgi:hypothetical protein